MIFRNKDAANSSIFGDSKQEEPKTPAADDSFLESMRRKAWSESPTGGDIVNKPISRASSASDDASRSGRAFLGMNSARSIFDNKTAIENSLDSRKISEVSRIEEKAIKKSQESQRRMIANPSGEEMKAGFSMHAREHARLGTSSNNVSIFDAKPFERLSSNEPELKKNVNSSTNYSKGASDNKQMTSNGVFERSFDSLRPSEKKETVHQSSVNKIWSALKGEKNA